MQFLICVACFFSIPLIAFSSRYNLHFFLTDIKRKWNEGPSDDDEYTLIQDASDRVATVEAPDAASNDAPESDQLDQKVDDNEVNEADPEENGGETRWTRLGEGLALVLTAALVALVFTNLSDAISLSGATYCCFISYLLPSTLYLVATNDRDAVEAETDDPELVRRKRYVAMFAIGWGCMLAVGGIVTVLI